MNVNEELKFLCFCENSEKKIGGSGGGVRWGVRVGERGVQGGCERRIEDFVKIQNKKIGRRGGVGAEGLGRGSGWGVRVGVNEELKFLGKFTKKNSGGGGVGRGVRWGVGLVGGQGGCERNVGGRG